MKMCQENPDLVKIGPKYPVLLEDQVSFSVASDIKSLYKYSL